MSLPSNSLAKIRFRGYPRDRPVPREHQSRAVSPPLPVPPPEDPVLVIQEWLDEATRKAVQRHPNTMTLATVDAAGRPSARVVLLKKLSVTEGFAVFHTHYGSRKGVELGRSPLAAAVMHWDELGRQVRLEGTAVPSPNEESDEYFATRSWRSQLNAWVSEQSQPLSDPSVLLQRATEKARQMGLPDPLHHGARDLEAPAQRGLGRPPFWGGYRLWFAAVELWMEGSDRFHDRLRYERSLTPLDTHTFQPGPWSSQRLQP